MAIPRISTERVSEARYRRLALGNLQLELHRGQLREKPGMSVAHGRVMDFLLAQLYVRLDRSEYRVRVQHALLRVSAETYYIPDIAIIPGALEQALIEHPLTLDAYSDPLPLVIEVWSPSTGDYDVNQKLPGYQQRGDREIWYVHPYQRTLTVWSRQPNGAYVETIYRGGTVPVESLPDVTIDLDALFAD